MEEYYMDGATVLVLAPVGFVLVVTLFVLDARKHAEKSEGQR